MRSYTLFLPCLWHGFLLALRVTCIVCLFYHFLSLSSPAVCLCAVVFVELQKCPWRLCARETPSPLGIEWNDEDNDSPSWFLLFRANFFRFVGCLFFYHCLILLHLSIEDVGILVGNLQHICRNHPFCCNRELRLDPIQMPMRQQSDWNTRKRILNQKTPSELLRKRNLIEISYRPI